VRYENIETSLPKSHWQWTENVVERFCAVDCVRVDHFYAGDFAGLG
jgi:hypothetical protein